MTKKVAVVNSIQEANKMLICVTNKVEMKVTVISEALGILDHHLQKRESFTDKHE